MITKKSKALVFYTYLPPWRIDIFNEMGKYFDLTIVFLNADCAGFTYNRDLLLSKLNVDAVFWKKGFNIGSKPFRIGISRILRKYKPEIVFTHEYSPTSIFLATLIRLRLFRFQLIVTTSDNLEMAKKVSGLKYFFRAYVLNVSKGIIVYSERVKEWYKMNFPYLNLEVCPNIQNPKTLLTYKKDFQPMLENYIKRFQLYKPVILYVGRLEDVKGLNLLIQAFSCSLKDSHHLVLVGEGSKKDELKALAKECLIEDSVIFTGFFDGAHLYAWYSLAQFFVLPSLYEPFGAVVNEALVFGCPVLASKHIGAVDFIIDGKNGFVFDPENVDEFRYILLMADKLFSPSFPNRVNLMNFSFESYMQAFKAVLK